MDQREMGANGRAAGEGRRCPAGCRPRQQV